jgi:hypothetical protein
MHGRMGHLLAILDVQQHCVFVEHEAVAIELRRTCPQRSERGVFVS